MTDQGALTLLLVAFCLGLQTMAGRALGLFWLAWRQEVRWREGVSAYVAMMDADFKRRFGIEAGRDDQ